ncbi:hypothetical protein DYB39_19705 [Providencia rettgeri]|nr:ATP-binding protein [Providencia sp. 1701011]QIF60411.1 ATP-binding protein [Providencia sp. 1701091]RFT08196.1 hypothetical protein DYB39_19705 [Providencia rettgeri]
MLLCEDEWLAALYPNELTELVYYIEKSALVKQVLEGHIKQLIQAGNNIVMDFPANTPLQRQWLRSLAQSSDVPYVFHVLQVSNLGSLALTWGLQYILSEATGGLPSRETQL